MYRDDREAQILEKYDENKCLEMFTNDTDDNDLPNQFIDIPVGTLINTEVEEHEYKFDS